MAKPRSPQPVKPLVTPQLGNQQVAVSQPAGALSVRDAYVEGFAVKPDGASYQATCDVIAGSQTYFTFFVGLNTNPYPLAQLTPYLRTLRARIHVTHLDGAAAGKFETLQGTANLVAVKDFTTCIPFQVDKRLGAITAWVEIFDATGQLICKSKPKTLAIVQSSLSVSYGQWEPSKTPQTYQRRIYVVVKKFLPQAKFGDNYSIDNERKPVTLRIEPAPRVPTSLEASWLSSKQGLSAFSDSDGLLITRMGSDPHEIYTAIQYWRETPHGTRQLNAYKVRASLVGVQVESQHKSKPTSPAHMTPSAGSGETSQRVKEPVSVGEKS